MEEEDDAAAAVAADVEDAVAVVAAADVDDAAAAVAAVPAVAGDDENLGGVVGVDVRAVVEALTETCLPFQ